jgi:hypothetical protein
MPVVEDLLGTILTDFGFEREYAIKCIESNRHNHITATYHLINKRLKRNAYTSQLADSQDSHPQSLKKSVDLNVTMPIQA